MPFWVVTVREASEETVGALFFLSRRRMTHFSSAPPQALPAVKVKLLSLTEEVAGTNFNSSRAEAGMLCPLTRREEERKSVPVPSSGKEVTTIAEILVVPNAFLKSERRNFTVSPRYPLLIRVASSLNCAAPSLRRSAEAGETNKPSSITRDKKRRSAFFILEILSFLILLLFSPALFALYRKKRKEKQINKKKFLQKFFGCDNIIGKKR